MTDQEILKKVAEAVTEKPVTITISRPPKNKLETWVSELPKVHQFLNSLGLFQFKKTIIVNALTLGTIYRISGLVNEIEIGEANPKKFNDWFYALVENNAVTLAEILAAAIHNQKSEPPQKLIEWLLHNLTAKDFSNAISSLRDHIDIASFTNTIVSVRSLNILIPEETSQAITGEKIALGRESGPQ